LPHEHHAIAVDGELGDLGHAAGVGVDAKVSYATDAYNQYHTKLQANALLESGKQSFVFSDVAYKVPFTRAYFALICA
jgi:hypothetical protein